MKNYIYSIYDRLAESYGPLVSFQNDNVAIRTFKEGCKNNSALKDHPEDLEIHRIGIFDDESGSLTENKEILERGEKYELQFSI